MFYIIPILYYSLSSLFKSINIFPSTTSNGDGNEYISYMLVSLGCISYITFTSFSALINNEPNKIENNRIYGYNKYIEENILYPMIHFQFWNLSICLVKEEFRKIEMISHHFFALLISLLCIYPHSYLHYYVPYFYMVEITSIFLTFIDIYKTYPQLLDKFYYTKIAVVSCFVITFFIFRILFWTYYNIKMINDIMNVVEYKSNIVVALTVPANLVMTFLQYYWQIKIFKKIKLSIIKNEN